MSEQAPRCSCVIGRELCHCSGSHCTREVGTVQRHAHTILVKGHRITEYTKASQSFWCPWGEYCHQIWVKSRAHLLLVPTLDNSHNKHLSRSWLWWEWPLAPVSRDSPIVPCNINITFIFLHSLTLHSTIKWAYGTLCESSAVHFTVSVAKQPGWAVTFCFCQPPDLRRNGNKLIDYLVMNNTPDVFNPVFCSTSTEAVDECSYNISLLSKKKKKLALVQKGRKTTLTWVTLLKEAHEMYLLQINLTEILKIRGVPQGVRLASQNICYDLQFLSPQLRPKNISK